MKLPEIYPQVRVEEMSFIYYPERDEEYDNNNLMFRRYWNDDEPKEKPKLGNWFLVIDDDIRNLPDFPDKEYAEILLKCFNMLEKME